jgi:hypothetical protein
VVTYNAALSGNLQLVILERSEKPTVNCPLECLVICGLHGKHYVFKKQKRSLHGMSRVKKPITTLALTMNFEPFTPFLLVFTKMI